MIRFTPYTFPPTMFSPPDLTVDGSVPAPTSTTLGASVSTELPMTLFGPIPSDKLSAIAYDRNHVPRAYPHRWRYRGEWNTWVCNCPMEAARISDAVVAAFKG